MLVLSAIWTVLKVMKVLTQKNLKITFHADKLVCVDDKFSKPIVVYRSENTAFKFIEATLKEYEYCKKVMKKHSNKNLIMTEKEEQFQSVGFVKNPLTMTMKK